ncbi:hypothetical protein ACN38_g12612 [Penicillium nordicum]|uniref:Uncharacterized protein n=1 Tax=Penicillium nordicum TaxID=229535 RepID=A0A0M8NX08_9EURO|nr:hypothetical protein ACN38_g12612 [Penicillium nordicum]
MLYLFQDTSLNQNNQSFLCYLDCIATPAPPRCIVLQNLRLLTRQPSRKKKKKKKKKKKRRHWVHRLRSEALPEKR